ncbi:hypothetical protein [Paracidovorax konjaci]|uniref:Uncharacterized protein n=1 Tax=Paracidovorax konjaci TaxID=32040 RepID=A0A1I1SZF3_9BURK|nr:hypothetical protein [Paracidovorax konjaci]SFD51835.1 hypothetical protein SAMN04489710_10321 [Paracidovorax konjaci]
MAKALFAPTTLNALTSLIPPLHALVRWLRGPSPAAPPSHVPVWTRWPDQPAGGVDAVPADGTALPDHPASRRTGADQGMARAAGSSLICLPTTTAPATATTPAIASPSAAPGSRPGLQRQVRLPGRAAATGAPGTVRVVKRRQAGAPERFVISGRMADVRAELERWAALEAVLH